MGGVRDEDDLKDSASIKPLKEGFNNKFFCNKNHPFFTDGLVR